MRNRQSGLSLIELMISITLGLVLMTGVIQMFLGTRAAFTTQQALARVQETGRLGVEFLARDIRMAGYMGCMSRNMNFTNTLNNSSDMLYDFSTGIEGEEVGANGATIDGYPSAMANTDILVIRSANGDSLGINKLNDSAQVFGDYTGEDADACGGEGSVSGLCIGDIVAISDCEKARVFQVTNLTPGADDTHTNIVHAASGTPGNAEASWGGNLNSPEENFSTDSQIIKISTTFYYVAENASGEPSLWRKVGSGDPEEMLEGVQNLQITYGRDTDGDSIPDDYKTASEISGTAWGDVSSVRLNMLVQSIADNVVPEPQAYTFNGTQVDDPGDRRMRQVFVTTVGIRSRLP